jgi:uncharacterized phosphosugar-binding protein
MTATVNEYFEKIFSSFSQELSADKKELFYKKYNEFKNKIPFDVARFARELGINLFGSKDFKESQNQDRRLPSVNYSIK